VDCEVSKPVVYDPLLLTSISAKLFNDQNVEVSSIQIWPASGSNMLKTATGALSPDLEYPGDKDKIKISWNWGSDETVVSHGLRREDGLIFVNQDDVPNPGLNNELNVCNCYETVQGFSGTWSAVWTCLLSQPYWENITAQVFETEDGKDLLVCFRRIVGTLL
jgi:hypothetical protein